MKFLKWLGIVILSLIALYFIIALFLPSTFHVERQINIDKPVDIVFLTATDMNQRAKWDPWIELDPDVEINVTMNPEIIGSGYTWKGEIIGEGKMTIKEFVANELIKSEIEFIVPQSMQTDIIWTFKTTDKGTDIAWAFEGKLKYPVEKWFGIFMEKSMGPQFEKGLNNFKALVESLPDLKGRTGEITESNFDGLIALSIKELCETEKLTGKMIEMYSSILVYLRKNDIEMTSSPFSIYHDSKTEGFTLLECGLPINKKIAGNDKIKYTEIPKGKVVIASHFGHFNTVKTTRDAINKYIKENKLEVNGLGWEMYITDPTKESDQSKWETKVFVPIK